MARSIQAQTANKSRYLYGEILKVHCAFLCLYRTTSKGEERTLSVHTCLHVCLFFSPPPYMTVCARLCVHGGFRAEFKEVLHTPSRP